MTRLRRGIAFTFNVVKRTRFWQTALLPHMNAAQQQPVSPPGDPPGTPASAMPERAGSHADSNRPREIGGRGGLEPTRYGDWERAGRCIDF
jgi:hypothetical protein